MLYINDYNTDEKRINTFLITISVPIIYYAPYIYNYFRAKINAFTKSEAKSTAASITPFKSSPSINKPIAVNSIMPATINNELIAAIAPTPANNVSSTDVAPNIPNPRDLLLASIKNRAPKPDNLIVQTETSVESSLVKLNPIIPTTTNHTEQIALVKPTSLLDAIKNSPIKNRDNIENQVNEVRTSTLKAIQAKNIFGDLKNIAKNSLKKVDIKTIEAEKKARVIVEQSKTTFGPLLTKMALGRQEGADSDLSDISDCDDDQSSLKIPKTRSKKFKRISSNASISPGSETTTNASNSASASPDSEYSAALQSPPPMVKLNTKDGLSMIFSSMEKRGLTKVKRGLSSSDLTAIAMPQLRTILQLAEDAAIEQATITAAARATTDSEIAFNLKEKVTSIVIAIAASPEIESMAAKEIHKAVELAKRKANNEAEIDSWDKNIELSPEDISQIEDNAAETAKDQMVTELPPKIANIIAEKAAEQMNEEGREERMEARIKDAETKLAGLFRKLDI